VVLGVSILVVNHWEYLALILEFLVYLLLFALKKALSES
jgi:hypothetical protein